MNVNIKQIVEEICNLELYTKAINQIIAGRDSFVTIPANNIKTMLGAEFDMNTDDIDTKLGVKRSIDIF